MIFLDHQRMNSINDKLYDIETSLLEIDTTEEIPYCATLIGLSIVYANPITGI